MAENTAIKAEEKISSTALTNVNDVFMPMIINQLTQNDIEMSPYAKNCVLHAISAIVAAVEKAGSSIKDANLDKSSITDVLLKVAALQLNASASPREVYFQVRNEKKKDPASGKEVWKKKVEMGIEGDGNDSILARFGRGIVEVGQYWKVREFDDFEYPSYDGLNMTAPKWTPRGKGRISKIVYPIIKLGSDGKRYVEFYISEREDVLPNLIAHISNNLMNETFGIAKDRYSANEAEKKEIFKKKKEIIDRAKSLTLDEALDDESLMQYISDAWTAPHSREAMIERKMRNNAIKKIPKDFGNGMIETLFEESADDFYRYDDRSSEMLSLPEEAPKKKDNRLDSLNRELSEGFGGSLNPEDIIDD